MRKVLFTMVLCLAFISNVGAQTYRTKSAHQIRVESGGYTCSFGLYGGYSTDDYIKVGTKVGGNKVMLIMDYGFKTKLPADISYSEKKDYLNLVVNGGLAYYVTPKFYIGVLGGYHHLSLDVDDTSINEGKFNYGATIGCVLRGIDLSINYTKAEQFTLNIGFLIRN